MLKKIVLFLLSVIILLSISGCGNTDRDIHWEETEKQPEQSAENMAEFLETDLCIRNAQWMFYPPEGLPVTADEAYHDGIKGELSYYEPWGDVFILSLKRIKELSLSADTIPSFWKMF